MISIKILHVCEKERKVCTKPCALWTPSECVPWINPIFTRLPVEKGHLNAHLGGIIWRWYSMCSVLGSIEALLNMMNYVLVIILSNTNIAELIKGPVQGYIWESGAGLYHRTIRMVNKSSLLAGGNKSGMASFVYSSHIDLKSKRLLSRESYIFLSGRYSVYSQTSVRKKWF